MYHNINSKDFICDAKELWPYEERDFTPWLKDNIDELSYLLGIHLNPVKTEYRIGKYEIDLLAEDGITKEKVVIENQYGCSDHKHLGQCLTYMNNVGAKSFVWISERFTDEHLCAVRKLNESTSGDYKFFAVSLICYKIGEEHYFCFNVEVKPDYFRKAKNDNESAKATERYAFWENLSKVLPEVLITPTYRSYIDIRLQSFKATHLGLSQANGQLKVYIWTYNEDSANHIRALLSSACAESFALTEERGSKNGDLMMWSEINQDASDVQWMAERVRAILNLFDRK